MSKGGNNGNVLSNTEYGEASGKKKPLELLPSRTELADG
jgi:hypothetical protein